MLDATPAPAQNRALMNTPVFTSNRRDRGFTLIELMVAVVVLGVVVAVALPSFLDSIRKSRRSEAMTALSTMQQAQERWRSNKTTYTATLSDIGITTATTAPGGYYALSIDSASATGYVLTANGTGSSQANDAQCAKLSVEVNGGAVKYASCSGSSCTFTYNPSDKCWSR